MNSNAAKKSPNRFDFPDPRPSPVKIKLDEGLSIDAILQRTQPSKRPVNRLGDMGLDNCFASLDAEETELREKERELTRLRADTFERIRVVRETEILLDARERLLDDREDVLAARMANCTPDEGMAALEKSLRDTRQTLSQANESLVEKEEIIAALREEMEDLRARASKANDSTSSSPMSYETITHASLADQVAFLREREAFIEQSENTLFDKAQHLQEWEARLEQDTHDQQNSSDDGANPGKSSSGGNRPIEFPRVAASQ